MLKHNLWVLCDEAYFDIRYEGRSMSFVSLPGMAERSVILYTFSKKFAMTGWRLGASIGPKPIIDVIAKLNVNDESCSNHFIQYGALEGLTGDPSGPRQILRHAERAPGPRGRPAEPHPGRALPAPERDLLPLPERHRGHAAQGARRITRRSGARCSTRRASRSVRGCTSGGPLPDETEFYIRLAYSGIDLPDIREALEKFHRFVTG